MKNGNNAHDFNDSKLKTQMRKILLSAKKYNIIKPHTLAFNQYPTQKEAHKGNPEYFVNQ